MERVKELLSGICSSRKLDRDNSLEQLQKEIVQMTPETVEFLEAEIGLFLSQPIAADHWEIHHGCLVTFELMILCDKSTETSMDRSIEKAIQLLDHKESRVRLAAGTVLAAASAKRGSDVYQLCSAKLLGMLNENLQLTTSLLNTDVTDPVDDHDHTKAKRVMQYSSECCLAETSMKCLQAIVERSSDVFATFITEELMRSVFSAAEHHNRFVRESAFGLCSALSLCHLKDSPGAILGAYEPELCQRIATGLADDWSQVRMAASIALRAFLQRQPLEHYADLWVLLLPPMCFNRYHLDAGLRLYSQETWRLVMGTEGKSLVSKLLGNTIEFYIKESHNINHVVRVASCHALSELIEKMNPMAMDCYADDVLKCLINAFHDANWMVKDAACLVTASFILSFPEKAKSAMPELMSLFFRNLQDPAQIVRQGAAESIVKIIPKLGDDVTQMAVAQITAGLKNLQLQPASSVSTAQKSGISAVLITKGSEGDQKSLQMSPVASTSKVPEFVDFESAAVGIERPPECWEIADGCVYLLNQLSHLPGNVSNQTLELLPLLITACGKRDYGHHVDFLETVLQLLPSIAKNVGKMKFKRFLEDFLSVIHYCVTCNCGWTEKAAKDCLSQLSLLIGPNIMRGRLEANHPELLVIMGSAGDSFSPATFPR